jgi:hypothetical protein
MAAATSSATDRTAAPTSIVPPNTRLYPKMGEDANRHFVPFADLIEQTGGPGVEL